MSLARPTTPHEAITAIDHPNWDIAYLSDRGLKRDSNEDAQAVVLPHAESERAPHGALFVVADGVGGLAHGEIASQIAVEQIVEQYYSSRVDIEDPWERINLALETANITVRNRATQEGVEEIASTASGVVIFPSKQVYFFTVGDSRVYRIRRNQIQQLTEDQTAVLSRVTDTGSVKSDTKLTSYLGQPQPITSSGGMEIARDGDVYLICTDGLWSKTSPSEIAEAIKGVPAATALSTLLTQVYERGANDNITATLVRIGAAPRALALWKRLVLLLALIGLGIGGILLGSSIQNNRRQIDAITATNVALVLTQDFDITLTAQYVEVLELTQGVVATQTADNMAQQTLIAEITLRAMETNEAVNLQSTVEFFETQSAIATADALQRTNTPIPSVTPLPPTSTRSPTHTPSPSPTITPTFTSDEVLQFAGDVGIRLTESSTIYQIATTSRTGAVVLGEFALEANEVLYVRNDVEIENPVDVGQFLRAVQVVTGDYQGEVGWLARETILASELLPTTQAIVFSDRAIIYNGNSEDFDAISELAQGTRVNIVGVSMLAPNWYLVDLPEGGTGWIAPDSVQVEGNPRTIGGVIPPATPIPVTATLSGEDVTPQG